MEAVSEVLIVVSSLWEMPSFEESTADLTKERLMVIMLGVVKKGPAEKDQAMNASSGAIEACY